MAERGTSSRSCEAIAARTIQRMPNTDAFIALAVALGCGLLVGIERERRKGQGPHRALAGVRSFAVAALSGAAAMLVGSALLVAVGAALFATLAVAAYRRDRSGDPGVTTEIALWLTYLIGVMAVTQAPLAAALAVALTALLAARDHLHRFASEWLRPAEVRDAIVLAALSLIVLPLAPDRPLWGAVLNPRALGQLFVALLAIQALAHLAQRLLQVRHAAVLSSLASGFVSSTASIGALGARVREGAVTPAAAAGAGLLTCVATMLQLLVVAATVQPVWLAVLWLPVLAGAAVAGAVGWWQLRGAPMQVTPEDARLFSLRSTGAVALLLTGVQAAVHAVTLWLGDTGFLLGTLLASLMDLHASAAAVLAHAAAGAAPDAVQAMALMAAVTVHSLNKAVVAALTGGRAYALRLLPGLLAQAVVFSGVFWLLR
jgi:uncharacterized membrane protein (DUF4010 family)